MISKKRLAALTARKSRLESMRVNWLSLWQEVSELVNPNESDYTTKDSQGQVKTKKVFDSTATHANENLAAGLHGMMTNPAVKWFGLALKKSQEGEDSKEVKEWLDATSNAMREEMGSFEVALSSHLHEFYLNLGSVGTSALFIGERPEGGIYIQSIAIADLLVGESQYGDVNTVFRDFEMTAHQMMDKWELKALPEDVKIALAKGNLDEKFTITHCVYPREHYDKTKKSNTEMPIASVYFYKDDVIQESGYLEMPYVVARWQKNTSEIYGRSPGMTALQDIKMLQSMAKTVIRSAQKVVDPTLLIPKDSVLSPIKTLPGSMIHYDSNLKGTHNEKITPLLTGGNIPIGEAMLEGLRNRIRVIFFNDQLQLIGGNVMTATEIVERTERMMRLMGPVLGRMESEFLGPLINRSFGVLFRQGRLPEVPEELQTGEEVEINIEYVSPLAKAQRQTDMQGIRQAMEMLGPMSQINQGVLDVINIEEAFRYIANLQGVPTKLLNSREELKKKREEQQQAEAEAQKMQQTEQEIAMVGQGVDAASKAKDAGLLEAGALERAISNG